MRFAALLIAAALSGLGVVPGLKTRPPFGPAGTEVPASIVAVVDVGSQKPSQTNAGWELVILGVAQDAGIPHLNCQAPLCATARASKRPARVSSIGIVNRGLGKAYLFDATPDFVSQVHDLTGGRPPDGIFLTHGHIGHYTGLMYLGRESIDASKAPVYGTARMTAYLRGNGPWSQLVTRNNIDLRPLAPDTAIDLGGGVTVTPFLVPHRDEFTDTVGFEIRGPRKRVLFIPDIDRWEKWDRSIRKMADEADLALLDGTFADATEIPGRSIDDIPHPMMRVTRGLLNGARAALWFIHLNHTNREIDARDVVKEGQRFPI